MKAQLLAGGESCVPSEVVCVVPSYRGSCQSPGLREALAPADRILGAQRGLPRPPSSLSLAGLGLRMTCSMLRVPGDTQSSALVSLGRVVPPSTEATVVSTGSASRSLFLTPYTFGPA